MKIAICNLQGLSICVGRNSNSAECMKIVDILADSGYSCDIIVASPNKMPKKEMSLFDDGEAPDGGMHNYHYVSFDDAAKVQYDKVLIMNAPVNLYNGELQPCVKRSFEFLSRCTGKLYYIFNDSILPFKQLSHEMSTHHLDGSMYELKKPITVLTDFSDLEYARKANSKRIEVEDVKPFSTAKTFFYKNSSVTMMQNLKKYDLVYGGGLRQKSKMKGFNEFLLSHDDLSVMLYGSFTPEALRCEAKPNWTFMPKVPNEDVCKMNSQGLASILIYGAHYERFITRRVYETMLAGCVMFVDPKTDLDRRLPNQDFIRVNSGAELREKVNTLKTDSALYDKILKGEQEFLVSESKHDCTGELLAALDL